MLKLVSILLVGLVFESTGIILLKKGMNDIGGMHDYNVGEALRIARAGVTNPHILSGVFFQALFFGCLLMLMSRSDISFLWPLTALSFVFATFAAMIFLHERVSGMRWLGVILIMIGAGFISYSEHAKEKSAPPAATPSAVSEK
jgi:drug/metabolite transporter (DMT)-like permease